MDSGVDIEEPDAGEDKSVLATVGAGEGSRTSASTGSVCGSLAERAGVLPLDLDFLDGGRGRGFDLLEEASSWDNVGM